MQHLKNALIRGGLPFVMMSGISLMMHLQQLDEFQVSSTFITGLIMTAVGASSVIYDVNSWPLLKQSLIHFLVMLLTVFPCLVFSGWFPTNTSFDIVKIVGIFVFTGLVLWSVSYLVFGKILKK